MARYTNVDHLIDYLIRATGHKATCDGCTDIDCVDCIRDEVVKNLPIEDVIPVIRCKDCNQSFQRYDHTLSYLQLWWCDKWKNIMRGCDYCSFGERRDIK
jgi:hypothetical protein